MCASCVVLCVRCSGPLLTCSQLCALGVLYSVCGIPGRSAPVHRCARSVCCVVCAVSWAPWLLFTGVFAPCVVLHVWCPGPLGCCLPVFMNGVLSYVCDVLRLFSPVRCCAPSGCFVACAVSRAPFAPLHRCTRSVCCVVCAVSWATGLRSTAVLALCGLLCVQCPGPLCSCSPVCMLRVLCCVCGVLGQLTPVHRCTHLVCCVVCAGFCANSLLFTVAHARCVLWCVQCPRQLGSCAPVCMPGAECARCRCPCCSCSPARTVGVLCCASVTLGLWAPFSWRAHLGVVCAVPPFLQRTRFLSALHSGDHPSSYQSYPFLTVCPALFYTQLSRSPSPFRPCSPSP